ncbi:MAG: hypothetical protein CML05_12845 [Pseudozobellia sp.]|nr:hypothetical protein [Pseudozobellia sp.]
MIKHFTNLQWKSFFRSSSFGKGLAMKIFMVFLGVYLLVSLAMAGVGMYFALEKIFPDEDPFLMVNRFIIYSFLLEIFVRYFFSEASGDGCKAFSDPAGQEKCYYPLYFRAFRFVVLQLHVPHFFSSLLHSSHSKGL